MKKDYRFLVRTVGTRMLEQGRHTALASELARSCKPLYAETVVRVQDRREHAQRVEFGYRRARLPGRAEGGAAPSDIGGSAPFAAAVLDGRGKLRVMAGYVARAAKRVFGVPEFACYAIADGLMSIFARYPGRITPTAPQPSGQASLLFDCP